MKRLIALAVVLVTLSAASAVWAGRCGGYADTSIAWCDDFDNYCTVNNPANRWPGYPPAVDTRCPTDDTAVADSAFFRDHWPAENPCGGGTYTMGVLSSPSGSGGFANSLPMVARYCGFGCMSQYHVWDMAQAIGDRHTGMNAVNGTDENPLQLRFFVGTGVAGQFANSPMYAELRLGDGKAPTDWVPKDCPQWHDCNCARLHTYDCNCDNLHPGDPTCYEGETAVCQGGTRDGQACSSNYWCSAPCADQGEIDQSQCWDGEHAGTLCYGDDNVCEDIAGTYPIVVQQHLNASITVPHPPQDTTAVYPALALGFLAELDREPCDSETGKKPTSYHVAVFDGNHWDDPRTGWYALPDPSGHGWSNYNDYNNLNSETTGWLQMDVMTTSFHIQVEGNGYSEGIVARQYTGPFNKIAMGTGPGCKLDGDPESPTYGQCLTEAACWDYAGWQNFNMDNMNVLDLDGGGVYVSLIGACCLENGTCDDLSQADCETAGGRFQGISTACDDPDILCCPYPWADKEADGDVDQMDFGAFQVCYTGTTGTGVPPGCECFDRDGDDRVDAGDYAEFVKCWTGANVPYKDVHPAGGCTP